MNKKSKLPAANSEIKAISVRLIDEKGEMLGVVSTNDALYKARKLNLDLVEVSPNAKPPVCKIIDFGKYKYTLQKKENIARKKQKTFEIKEIKLRPNIGEHDFEIKCKAVEKFLLAGDKVKISMRFRGRELYKKDIAFSMMKKVFDKVEEISKVEVSPKMEGRQLLMILASNK
jgi:translation initiation factor IF-3